MSANGQLLIEPRLRPRPEETFFPSDDEVRIRLGVSMAPGDLRFPEAYYLAATGFYKLREDLEVRSFRASLTELGLVFFLRVSGSPAAIKAYLRNLKRWHALGNAWSFTLIDGMHLIDIDADPLRGAAAPSRAELEELCETHMQMGSRPLRFSKYLLYAALAPFGRKHTFGACGMDSPSADGLYDFHDVLIALEIIMRSYRGIDLSRAKSLSDLRAVGRPLESALEAEDGRIPLRGMLFHSLFFAACYEQKTRPEAYVERIASLAAGLEKDFLRPGESGGLALFRRYGIGGSRMLAMLGYEPIFKEGLDVWRRSRDMDLLSLYLLSQTYDTTALCRMTLEEYRELRDMTGEGGVSPERLAEEIDGRFVERKASARGISDLVSLILLVDRILREEEV